MKNTGFLPALALLLAAFVTICAPAGAQVTTSDIAGTVTDETGAVVPGATIKLIFPATGQEREATTNASGEYVFSQLPPGAYELSATAQGFRTARVENVHLQIAQRQVVNISLQLGQVTEQITVSASAAELAEPETASLGQLIEEREVRELPLNGRNYLTLGSLSPGVAPQIPSSQGPASFISATTQRSDRSILVGGNRESSNSYVIDGIDVRNPRVGDTSINPSLDAVQEFKIQRNFFKAEFGFLPSVINVATKGGSNQIHGSAFEFLRNENLDASNFFAPEAEPFKRNQFGFSLGGPVIKNKAFVFGNYEGLRQRLGVIQRGLFPTTTMLSGDFSGEPAIHDPLTFDESTQSRDPFPNNRVPESRINQVSRNFFEFIPETNAPTVQGANLTGTPVQELDDDQFNIRGDVLLTDKHSIFGRFSYQDAPLNPASLVPLGGRAVLSEGRNAMLQLTSTLSPTTVNVFRASYHFAFLFGQQVPVDRDIAAEIGITNVSSVPINFGVPNVAWQGFSSIGSDGLTQGNRINNYEIQDSISIIKGSHSIKIGGQVRQSRMFLDSDNSPRGSFTFSPVWTAQLGPDGAPLDGSGQPVADFLLGFPQAQSGAVGTTQTHFQFWQNALFIQDDWKVAPTFTINLGLRWEYVSPPLAEELNNISNVNFEADGSTNVGLQKFPILRQVRDTVVERDWNDFAPRVGFAWNPSFQNSSWVFRAGAGIYYDQTQANELQFMTNSPPTFTQQNQVFEGRGFPKAEFGVNSLPDVRRDPITPDFETPQGAFPFAIEERGDKPRVYMWTFSIQKTLGDNWLAEGAYVGSSGARLSKRFNGDADATPGVLFDVTPGVRRFPGITGILFSTNSGLSNFNALNLKLERRFAEGLSLLTAFSWSHSIDTDSAGSFGTPNLNPANFELDRGSSDFDIRNRWVTSLIYELPFGRGKRFGGNARGALNQLIGGWQFNAITSWQTGVNRSVTASNRSTIPFIAQRADATGIDPFSEFTTEDGRTIDPGENFGSGNSDLFFFNPNAFSQPAALRFGTSGRTLIEGPGFWNFDLSLFKNFQLNERFRLQFRSEFFNAFNNTQFNPPTMNVNSPNFGTLQSAQLPRVIQFGLRLDF